MRLDVVDPEQEGAAAAGVVVEPGQGLLVDVPGGGLAAEEAQPAPAGEHFVVGGEVLGEAREAVAEGPVGDEAGGDVAAAGQHLGQRRQAAADAEAVAGGAVLVGVERGEHRGDRGRGQRLHGARRGEARRAGEQTVEVGAGGAAVAVAREAVRPQGVDGDEEDVGRLRCGGSRLGGGRRHSKSRSQHRGQGQPDGRGGARGGGGRPRADGSRGAARFIGSKAGGGRRAGES